MNRGTAAVLALVVTASGLVATQGSAVAADDRVTHRLHRAVEELRLASEDRDGYDRDKFRHWVDADGDCRDTRDEVLAAESLVAVTGCDVQTGKWRSSYDGATTKDSTAFDVDHLVPLAEAWDSGARRWNARTRQRYANDLRDDRSLVAVSATSNRSKSDRDPSEWMPAQGTCRYVRQWVAVKTRWRLTVNRPERRALRRLADDCRNVTISVLRAPIGRRAATDGGGLDPRYDYCYEAKADGYGPYRRGEDPEYDWYSDADDDGVVCE